MILHLGCLFLCLISVRRSRLQLLLVEPCSRITLLFLSLVILLSSSLGILHVHAVLLHMVKSALHYCKILAVLAKLLAIHPASGLLTVLNGSIKHLHVLISLSISSLCISTLSLCAGNLGNISCCLLHTTCNHAFSAGFSAFTAFSFATAADRFLLFTLLLASAKGLMSIHKFTDSRLTKRLSHISGCDRLHSCIVRKNTREYSIYLAYCLNCRICKDNLKYYRQYKIQNLCRNIYKTKLCKVCIPIDKSIDGKCGTPYYRNKQQEQSYGYDHSKNTKKLYYKRCSPLLELSPVIHRHGSDGKWCNKIQSKKIEYSYTAGNDYQHHLHCYEITCKIHNDIVHLKRA